MKLYLYVKFLILIIFNFNILFKIILLNGTFKK